MTAMDDLRVEDQLRQYREWLDKHRAEYDGALAKVRAGGFDESYRAAVRDALERLRAFQPSKDPEQRAVYAVAQAVLILGQAEQPLYTIKQYESNVERYEKLVRAKDAKK